MPLEHLCAISPSPRCPRNQSPRLPSFLLLEMLAHHSVHTCPPDMPRPWGGNSAEPPLRSSPRSPIPPCTWAQAPSAKWWENPASPSGLGSDLLGRKVRNKTVLGRYEKMDSHTPCVMVTSQQRCGRGHIKLPACFLALSF